MNETPLPAASVQLEFTGDKTLLPNKRSNFFEQMSQLCTDAGLTGVVKLRLMTSFRDLSYTPGPHVHAPRKHGVGITWQRGDNWCLRVILGRHNGMASDELYRRLKGSLEVSGDQTQKGDQHVPKPPDTESVLAKILGKDGDEPSAVVATAEQRELVTAPKARGEGPLGAFTLDADNVELFLSEIATKANGKGEVSTSDCVSILRADFGFPPGSTGIKAEQNLPYAALLSLSKRRILEKIDLGYRIPAEKFAEFAKPKTGEIEPANSATEAVVTLTVENASPPIEAPGLEKKFEALAERVTRLRSQRQWLVDLEKEHVGVVDQIKLLEERKSALDAEMGPITQALQSPQATEDEAAYDAIMKLLNR